MATGIPLPGAPGEDFLKGISTGSDMFRAIMNARYNNSLHPSGDVANALYVEQLKNQYGENDPRYLEAKRAHDMAIQARQSLIGYRDILNQTAGVRYSSPLGKEIAEGQGRGAQDILNNKNSSNVNTSTNTKPAGAVSKVAEQWYDAKGNPVYADENPRTEEERQAYESAIAKRTSDAAVRNKIPYAENVEITLDSIVPKDLFRYSGLKGQMQYLKDFSQAALGNPSPEFIAYNNSVTAAKMGAKQLRQFWGDSIQPSAREAIEALTNPSTWHKDPKIATEQFEQLKAITKRELGSFVKHGTSPIKLSFNKGKFETQKAAPHPTEKRDESKKGLSMADKFILEQYVPELLKINPRYTAKAIQETAKLRNLSIAEVIDQLKAKGK